MALRASYDDVKLTLHEEKVVSHEKRIARMYYREMAIAFVVYALLLTGGLYLARTMADGPARTALVISPMLGFGLMIWAIGRQVARMDEYQRMRLLETIAIAAAITAGATFTYGFMEGAGFPRLSMFTVWELLALSTGLVQLGRKVLNR
jgi:hypothetical protein